MTLIRSCNFCCFMMASYFGEIIEPTSRAIFDDCTDDEESNEDTEFQLSWTHGDDKLPSVFDVIFIIHGRLSIAFAELCLIQANSSPVAEINIVETRNNIDQDIENHDCKCLPSRIYIDDYKVLCLVSPSCSEELGNKFTETISSLLKASKKVIILTNDSIYNFKANRISDLPPAFIKELKTSYNVSQNVTQQLQAPNFITGISAAVISWCQIFGKDASAFVCYTDQEKLDSITASPYFSVLNKLSYKIIKNDNLDSHRKSYYGKPDVVGGSSNIYM